MRAWTYRSRGTPAQVLKLENDLPQPTADSLGPRDVLLKVNYAAVFQGSALLMTILPHINNKAWIPEFDVVGIVEAVGSKVTEFNIGDEVFGGAAPDIALKYNGVLAEYIVRPDDIIIRKPANLSLQGAAGIASCGVTAVQFMEVTKLGQGNKVLVTGASGGTGSLVVQAARAAVGAEGIVVGTCSAANEELVKGLGVDEVIDYKQHPRLHEYLREHHSSMPFDAIIDITGTDPLLYNKSPAYLKEDGLFLFGGAISMTHGSGSFLGILAWVVGIAIASRRPVILGGIPRRCTFHSGHVDKASLQKLVSLIEQGKVKPVVDSVWEMEDVLKAYELISTARARGKITIHIRD